MTLAGYKGNIIIKKNFKYRHFYYYGSKRNGAFTMRKNYIFGLFLCFILISFSFTACIKKKTDENSDVHNTITPTVTSTPTPTIVAEETIKEPTPTIPETEDTVEEIISQTEALKMVQSKIDERGYFVELFMDKLVIDDRSYYVYHISDGSSVIEPNVIVDQVSGEMLCYQSDGSTAPFSDFPLYTETVDTPVKTNEFTKEDAYEKLNKLSAKTLGLPEKLQQYTIEYDGWTTNVKGMECYGINVFDVLEENKTNMGVYYVALDGTKMFMFDSMLDDFVELEAN